MGDHGLGYLSLEQLGDMRDEFGLENGHEGDGEHQLLETHPHRGLQTDTARDRYHPGPGVHFRITDTAERLGLGLPRQQHFHRLQPSNHIKPA